MGPQLTAAGLYHTGRPSRRPKAGPTRPGALMIATSADRAHRRIVLVTTTCDDYGTAEVLLTTNRTEMATDLDAIIRATRSAAPYDLLVQAELYGTLDLDRLNDTIGRIPAPATAAIAQSLRSDGASLDGVETGTPLGGPDDPRRPFKANELESLAALVANTVNQRRRPRAPHGAIGHGCRTGPDDT